MKHKMKTKHGGLPMKQQNAAIMSSFFPGQCKRQKQKEKTMSKSMIIFWLVPYFFLFFISCGSKLGTKVETLEPENQWYRYISAHTSGTISKKSRIRVLFVKDIAEKVEPIPDASKIIEFTPGIKGQAGWINHRELLFIPEKELAPGTQYTATLHLAKRLDLPKNMKDFSFNFTVIRQDFEIQVEGLSFEKDSEKRKQKLRGKLITADVEDCFLVEKILMAHQEGKVLHITWEHNHNGKTHKFIIESIQRKKTPSKVLLQWDGKPIGVTRTGKRDIPVAPLGQFKVLETWAVQENHQYITVRFSDPLDKNQNLNGLIWISNHQVRYTIDGNVVKVYLSSFMNGQVRINIEKGIKNSYHHPLQQSSSHMVVFKNIPPEVRFIGKGVILPENDRLTVPFEAVNLHSVQVTAFQVYTGNMGQFLQVNNLKGTEELKRVGRYLWRKTIPLSQDREVTGKWSSYSLDVTSLFKKNPGSLFRLELSFNRGNSTFPCGSSNNSSPAKQETTFVNDEDFKKEEHSNWDYYDNYYDYNSTGKDWRYRNDPCYDAYYDPRYNSKKVRSARNFIASNTGIVAKMGENSTLSIVTTDIRTAQPLAGARITAYNFQNQPIGEARSNQSGFAKVKVKGVPFYVTADTNNDRGYLKVNSNTTLPLSHFDIGGEKIKKGIKGYIYGERGVWRPGDTIYLTFVLQDKKKILPRNHPVMMEVYNPKGHLVKTISPQKFLNNFHIFKITTDESALTGNWKARVLVGGLVFDKVVKVETVVPNRLKINLDFGRKILLMEEMPVSAVLFSQWLHGANASNLESEVKARFSSIPTRFPRFQDYVFDDPAREYAGGEQGVFKGRLDDKGRATFDINLKVEKNSPGMLNASFETRVFEEGGGFSVDRVTVPFHPYDTYVGIKTPKGDETRGMLLTDKEHTVRIAAVDPTGNPVSRDKIEVCLYKISWKWWWDKSGESLAQYASASNASTLEKGVISIKNGIGEWKFEVKYPDWGRYLIRACDPVSGHCTGKIVYIDWPGWAGRAREEKGLGATRLNFTADKANYKVGETAVVYLPEAAQGRALVSLENGSDVLEQRWVETREGENRFNIKLTKKMSPNIYVHVTLLQPHANKENDNPIRLYGVIPILVDDPDTRLHPTIKTTDEFRPGENIRLNISEKKGKPMTYTLAIVDEGLLGLTRYKTPDPRKVFYQREALGIKTWDLFDDVVGTYGGQLERILGIGGDGTEREEKQTRKKRFPPVVIFKGPFYLEEGKTAAHDIKLPQYIGEVRVMVVAGHKVAYGCDEKSVPVRQDLMLLSALPRVLRPGEELQIPVSVFVMNPALQNVQVKINTDNIFEVPEKKIKTVKFTKPGDEIVFFQLKTKPRVGQGRITITAASGTFKAMEETHITVMNPNPRTVRPTHLSIEPGKSWRQEIKPFGLKNTNSVTIEVSVIPTMKLEGRLNYLFRFPHGCLEQTISKIFPQLYLSALVKLTETEKKKIEHHIRVAIDKLRYYQISSGGFTYWPSGGHRAHLWATNYTGHFLLEAQQMGYYIPDSMLSRWLNFQKSAANSWTSGGRSSTLTQAFRLYTLALARQPDLGAMNRLRESNNLESTAAIQLAAAFSLVGQGQAAENLLKKSHIKINSYQEHSGTFGSAVRDKALILGILTQMKKTEPSQKIANEIVEVLGSDKRLNTQETAYALMALSAYYRVYSGSEKFHFQLTIGDDKPVSYASDTPIFKKTLDNFPFPAGAAVEIKNPNSVPLFAVVYNEGVPTAGEEQPSADRLTMSIYYYDTNSIPIDVSNIQQGKDFIAEIKITNPTKQTYENVVLNHIFPSGWQIHNPRFDRDNYYNSESDYQDIRDDRIYTYFSLLARGEKTFRVLLNASYSGRYYLPGVISEAMYDAGIHAKIKGQWVEVK